MDDLSDLVWSQPQKKKTPPLLPKKPANLATHTAAKPPPANDDVFGNLVDFRGQSKADRSNLSLAEQQQQQQQQQSNKLSSPFASPMGTTLSPKPAQYSPSPRSSGYNSDTQRVLAPTVQRPTTLNKQSGSGDAFDSLLDPLGEFGRGSGSKSPASSLNAMRSHTSTPSNYSDKGVSSENQPQEQQWNLDLFDQTYMKSPERSASVSPAPPANLDPFDMDPFEPSTLSRTKHTPTTTLDDADNPLGILAGPPVKVQPTPPVSNTPPPPPSPPSVDPRDHLVQQVVEMGFTRDQAQNALDATENGSDVSLAIELLLQDREAATRSRQSPAEQKPSRRQAASSNETARQQLWGEDNEDTPRRPPRSSGSGSKRFSPQIHEDERMPHVPLDNKQAPTFQQHKEKIVTQASEIGGFLYKNASLFVKSSREKVEKYMQDIQTEGEQPKTRGSSGASPSRPRWMTETHDYSDERVGSHKASSKYEKYADESSDEDPEEEKRNEEVFRLERERQRKKYVAEQKASKAKQQQLLDTADTYVSPSRRRTPTPSGPSSGRSTPQPASPSNLKRTASPKVSTPKQRPARTLVEASSSQIESANSHKQRGNEFFKLGQYSEAEQAYSQAIMQLPRRHDHLIVLYNNRAAALFKNGEYKRAIEDSSTAVQHIGDDHLDDASTHIIQGANLCMRDQAVKALTRKAQALENLEKYSEAIIEYNTLLKIDGGKSANHINQGLARCRKSINNTHKAEQEKPPADILNGHSTTSSNPFSVNFDPIMATPSRSSSAPAAPTTVVDVDKSEAVKQMRAKAAQQEAEDDERLKVTDDVDRRLQAWKHSKEKNLRALLASIDTVLWPEATWKGANMSELIEPKRCKIIYMKAIAKVHPDKLGSSVTVEQKMLASGIFGTLNDAWDTFKTQNGL